jgi:hypothetical protein
MPVLLDILDGGHIHRYTYLDPWTMEEYEAVEDRDLAHRESVSHLVHSIAIAKLRTVPAGALRVRNTAALRHRTAGHVAVVGATTIVQRFADVILSVARFDKVTFHETEEAALVYLRELIKSEQAHAS